MDVKNMTYAQYMEMKRARKRDKERQRKSIQKMIALSLTRHPLFSVQKSVSESAEK